MNSKKQLIIFLALFLLMFMPLTLAQGNITNLIFDKLLGDFIAGETAIAEFSFKYPDFSEDYPNQEDGALLVIIINISSNDSHYPVEKGDFKINGSMKVFKDSLLKKEYNFQCSEDNFILSYPYIPVNIFIPKGNFYCTNTDFLATSLNSINKVNLNLQPNQALWPGQYNLSISLFYPEKNISTIKIFSPVQNAIYNNRMVLLNMSMNGKVVLKYSDNNGNFITICLNCESYSKKKPFDDGKHNLTIQAIFDSGTVLKDISFIVDSKKPVVKDVEPKKGFAFGEFKIHFEEANPKSLILYYGNNLTGYRNKELNLSECTQKKNIRNCTINVSLSDYNQQKIYYWFNLKDILNKQAESQIKILDVDFSKPIINSFSYNITKRYVIFKFDINEKNFDSIKYIDYSEKIPRFKILCRKLINGKCESKIIFKKEEHTIIFEILDKAGNSVEEKLEFINY
ncbi:MAG: hypothetical protein Q8N99_07250 [Nanoarchaeota archaeon]|nr:hypothetical protein [Nanoarchaeota archaeon]